jgi:hypothetical protein
MLRWCLDPVRGNRDILSLVDGIGENSFYSFLKFPGVMGKSALLILWRTVLLCYSYCDKFCVCSARNI